jgi:acetyl esterase
MSIDEATSGFLTAMAEAGPPIHELSAADARSATGALKDMYGPGPEMAESRDETVHVDGGDILVRVLRPNDAPRGVLVYFHGGGWVIGSVEEYDTLGRQLAEGTGLTTLLVGYRKAPEHRYPTAVDDAWAALAWADTHRSELGVAADAPLVVAGDSAGGNLSAVLTQRARAAGGPSITAQVLIYPATRLDVESPSYREPENQLLLTAEGMRWFFDHYIPDQARREELDASPGRADDLSGLPPAVVVIAEHDPLRDEGEEYARRLAEAGVPVRSRTFERQMHGFFQMINILPGSAEGMRYVTEELTALLDQR